MKQKLEIENSVLTRLIGALSLLLLGSYLFAMGFTGITLLPLTVVAVGSSGSNDIPCGGITPFCTTASLQQLTQIFISELAFGIIGLAGAFFVAFFKFGTIGRNISQPIPQPSIFSQPSTSLNPQLSKPSELSTEELISELKQRMPRA